MDLVIRQKSSAADIMLCARLMASSPPWNELFFTEEHCISNISDPILTLYVCEHNGEFVGFLATRATGMEGEPLLEYICVDPRYRGKGLGTKMLSFVEDSIYPNANNIYLFVSDINPEAIKLYKRVGYTQVGQLNNYNLWGQTEYIFRKFRRPRQQKFVPVSNLTRDQFKAKDKGAIDLNSGYAHIALPQELKDCILEGTKTAFTGTVTYESSKERLQAALAPLLSIPLGIKDRIRSTFSGSIAIDRVFSAIGRYTQNSIPSKSGLTAILPEPSIDLWQLLLKDRLAYESQDVRIKGVRHREMSSECRINDLINELEDQSRRAPERKIVVILDSPSNPLGLVTNAYDIKRLAVACREFQAILVVDHCFLLAGLHQPQVLPNVFNLPCDICDWIGIWDTGKSIDLAGDKLGFIVSSNNAISHEIDEALAVIQPDTYTALRSTEVFSRLLASPHLPTYLATVGETCRKNLDYLHKKAHSNWTLNEPRAGTFACVYFQDSKMESTELQKVWLEAGVNVAAGKSFFRSTAGEGTPFLRISLIRESEYFKKAIALLDVLN